MNSKLKRYAGMSLSAIALTGTIGCGAKTNNIDLSADEPRETAKQEQVISTYEEPIVPTKIVSTVNPDPEDFQEEYNYENKNGYIVVYERNPITEDYRVYTEKSVFIPDDSIDGVIKITAKDYSLIHNIKNSPIKTGYIVVYEQNPITEDYRVYTEKSIFVPDANVDGLVKVTANTYSQIQNSKPITIKR